MTDSNEISNNEYEYEYAYSDNNEDENAEMDVNDGDFEDDELPSTTHKNAKHTQKSPSITPRNSDAHMQMALLDSLDMSTFFVFFTPFVSTFIFKLVHNSSF